MKQYSVPSPIVDDREGKSLATLQDRYDKLVQPGVLAKVGNGIAGVIPGPVKQIAGNMANGVTSAELYKAMMKIVATGYAGIEQQVSKYTLSRKLIIAEVDKVVPDNHVERIDEICLARGYALEKVVASLKMQNSALAFVEGGVTGALGFIPGVASNLVASSLLFFRAVQSVALVYGYDVKDDPAELVIAGTVFTNAMDPAGAAGAEGLAGTIGKIMMKAELAGVKHAVGKGWGAMIAHGGAGLLIAQIRALANRAAAKALEKAGKGGLEKHVFSTVLKQIGRKLTLKSMNKVVPIVGGVIGAGFDTAQMMQIFEYADVFYHKRFLVEKSERIKVLTERG